MFASIRLLVPGWRLVSGGDTGSGGDDVHAIKGLHAAQRQPTNTPLTGLNWFAAVLAPLVEAGVHERSATNTFVSARC